MTVNVGLKLLAEVTIDVVEIIEEVDDKGRLTVDAVEGTARCQNATSKAAIDVAHSSQQQHQLFCKSKEHP